MTPLILCALLLTANTAAAPGYDLAVTFDDLPAAVAGNDSYEAKRDVTKKLVAAIASRRVPAIGFVNAQQLLEQGTLAKRRLGLLRQWRDAGLELGNHTFSHRDLHAMSEGEFEDEVVRGEQGVKDVLAERGGALRWFRHPFLHTGRSAEARQASQAFLEARGYRVAPVTIDSSEWIFARAYDTAVTTRNRELAKRIKNDYVSYMLAKSEYYRQQARQLLGREIAQVLLLHANRLNADTFKALADALHASGARFVSLDSAWKDDAYRSSDTYFGAGGISWIHRWALSAGKKRDFFAGEPIAPEYILKAAGVDSE